MVFGFGAFLLSRERRHPGGFVWASIVTLDTSITIAKFLNAVIFRFISLFGLVGLIGLIGLI